MFQRHMNQFAQQMRSAARAASQSFHTQTPFTASKPTSSSSSTRFTFTSSGTNARAQFERMYSTFRRVGQAARSGARRTHRGFSSFMSNMGQKYSDRLESHPFTTQMITSGILGGAADVTTQHLEHGWAEKDGKEAKPWDMRRLAAVTAFGIIGMGPMGHVWYIALDKFCKRFCKTNRSMVITKVCGDTFVFGPVCLWLFFASVSVMEGTPWETIRRKLWRDFVPTYLIDYSFWPLVQGTNFHFVPVRHQLLVVNSVCYLDDIFLTYIQHNELPRVFVMVEEWWERYYEKHLLKPGEKMEDIFFHDADDD